MHGWAPDVIGAVGTPQSGFAESSEAGILDEAGEALDRAALFLRQRVRG
jgi:hypothetical protein